MRRILIILCVATIAVTPLFVSAQITGPLVPCEGPECQACHVVELGQRIVNFLVGIASFIAVLLFAWAGFLMVTAAGNEGQVSKAKGMFMNVFIGMVIVLLGWLIVDTLMKYTFVGSQLDETTQAKFGGWNRINCVPIPRYQAGTGETASSSSGTLTPVPSAGCPNCVAIDPSVASCKDPRSCTVDASFAQNLNQLSGFGLRVTEGYPPTRTHQNSCHTNGTCLDVTISDWSVNNVRAFQEKAQAAGYHAVYEPPAGVSCPSGVACLPYTTTRSTGHHFSLYKN